MENKTGKYLKYAIGEILLVVIGILIALSINNWNENNKKEDTLNNIYSIIKKDLEQDITAIENSFNIMNPREEIFIKVMNKSMTYEDYINCNKCGTILDGYPDYTMQKHGLDLLEDLSQFINTKNDSLPQIIINFYAYFDNELKVDIDDLLLHHREDIIYYKNNMSWFGDYYNGIIGDEFITYALNSWDYRNRVTEFHLLYYKIYFGHLRDYKKKAKEIIALIDSHLNK
ncbi:DUF6090 family protein [Thalassobellus citreus]|uniref:DUF6090 family protein n=1 Tax=Thalassobellus citreus TaxID=3367752 RepID=UPI003F6E198E